MILNVLRTAIQMSAVIKTGYPIRYIRSTVRLLHKSHLSNDCSVNSVCKLWTKRFEAHQIPEAQNSSELIIAHVIGKKTLSGIPSNQELTCSQCHLVDTLCEKRLQRMPIQYIIEEWDFRDLTLHMKAPVLIPRPETEDLVSYIIKEYANSIQTPLKILDIGCGSGAIILCLAKEFPNSACFGIDKNGVACKLTLFNAQKHSLQDKVTVKKMELSDATVQELKQDIGKFDIIVSNPPYIKTRDLEFLQDEISRYEDVEGALHAGIDGLSVIRMLLVNVQHLMHCNSTLWLEVDRDHPQCIEALVADNRHYKLTYQKTLKDFLGVYRFCMLTVNDHCKY